MPSCILIVVLLSILLLAALWYKYRPRTLPGIPCWPHEHPILGDLVRLHNVTKNGGSFTDFLDLSAKTLGPVCQIRLGPFAHMVIITDYQEVESLLLRRHSSLDRSNETMNLFRTILPQALLTMKTGDTWRHHRKIIGPAMTTKYLSLTMPNVTRTADLLIELWCMKGQHAAGRTWEAEMDLESATMDAICGMAFGQSWGVLEGYIRQLRSADSPSFHTGHRGDAVFALSIPDLAESTWYMFDVVPVQSPFPQITHFFSQLTPSYIQHTRRIDQFLIERIERAKHKAKSFAPEVALDTADNTLDLMMTRQLYGEQGLSDFEIKQELFQYLLAGTETSSTTLAWWCKFMTNHPHVQRKLHDHLLTRLTDLNERRPTYEELSPNHVPYLEAVVHETLRLARTAGAYLRDTKEDLTILGHHVPKGTTLVFPTSTGYEDRFNSISALPFTSNTPHDEQKSDIAVQAASALGEVRTDQHPRRVGHWSGGTGDQFDPERWMTPDGKFNAVAGPSLPFSLGQRRCFGKNLALMELRVFIAKLNLAFFFAPVPQSQNGFERFDKVISHPRDCYIRPVRWETVSPDERQ
ncbi:hypothetical protein IAT40_004327 [Kwoniella sp. CBS 6097]